MYKCDVQSVTKCCIILHNVIVDKVVREGSDDEEHATGRLGATDADGEMESGADATSLQHNSLPTLNLSTPIFNEEYNKKLHRELRSDLIKHI